MKKTYTSTVQAISFNRVTRQILSEIYAPVSSSSPKAASPT